MTRPGFIHERAVKMIYEALHGAYGEFKPEPRIPYEGNPRKGTRRPGMSPVFARCFSLDGQEYFQDLGEGIERVKIPDEWDSVGGIVPDLILYGFDDKPYRIIEVVNTSSPTKAKKEKLETLMRRGVDVVVIEVRTEEDLAHLFTWGDGDAPVVFAKGRDRNGRPLREGIGGNGLSIMRLASMIAGATPEERRALAKVLRSLEQLDSLYPV